MIGVLLFHNAESVYVLNNNGLIEVLPESLHNVVKRIRWDLESVRLIIVVLPESGKQIVRIETLRLRTIRLGQLQCTIGTDRFRLSMTVPACTTSD